MSPHRGSSVAQMNESSLTKERRVPSPYTSESLHPDQREIEDRHF
jgi:hypothetical protein